MLSPGAFSCDAALERVSLQAERAFDRRDLATEVLGRPEHGLCILASRRPRSCRSSPIGTCPPMTAGAPPAVSAWPTSAAPGASGVSGFSAAACASVPVASVGSGASCAAFGGTGFGVDAACTAIAPPARARTAGSATMAILRLKFIVFACLLWDTTFVGRLTIRVIRNSHAALNQASSFV